MSFTNLIWWAHGICWAEHDSMASSLSMASAMRLRCKRYHPSVIWLLCRPFSTLGVASRLPQYLQLDNELSFRGSNRYPRSFGLLVRTCLQLGVEVSFIPEGEPWRNGIVERFNDVYDKLFIRQQQFHGLEHLQRELAEFERFHNHHHRYAKPGQRTPWALHGRSPRRAPSFASTATLRQLPWKDGRISFIRLTDQHGAVRFFTERFVVDPSLVHEYVKGTIFT